MKGYQPPTTATPVPQPDNAVMKDDLVRDTRPVGGKTQCIFVENFEEKETKRGGGGSSKSGVMVEKYYYIYIFFWK